MYTHCMSKNGPIFIVDFLDNLDRVEDSSGKSPSKYISIEIVRIISVQVTYTVCGACACIAAASCPRWPHSRAGQSSDNPQLTSWGVGSGLKTHNDIPHLLTSHSVSAVSTSWPEFFLVQNCSVLSITRALASFTWSHKLGKCIIVCTLVLDW